MSAKKKTEPAKAAPQPATPAAQPAVNIFNKLGSKAPLVALGVITLICLIVFKDFLFGDKVYFFKDIGCDNLNYSYPYMRQVADYMAQHGTPSWSFNMGMGQSLYPFFLRDPFDIFLFLGGKDHLYTAIIYKEVIKVILTGLLFFYYLKNLRLTDYTAIIGSMMMAFCSFIMVGGGWYFFSYEAFNMVLLLLAFEQLFNRNRWFLFPVAIFLIAMSQPFNLYVYGIFLAVYAVFRCLQSEVFNGRRLAILFGKMIGLGLIGLLISGPFLIENVVQLLESPRGSGNTSYAHVLASTPMFNTVDKNLMGTSMLRLFSSDILGASSDFKGWQNYLEAPMFYTGLLALLLAPQVFRFLDRRTKIVFGVFLALWLLPVIFPYFRYAFWLFTGDYFRAYSFLVGLVLLLFSMQALDRILAEQKLSLITLGITVAVLLILLNYPYSQESITVSSISMFVTLLLIAYAVLLYLMSRPGRPVMLCYVFFAAVAIEVAFLSLQTTGGRDAITLGELKERVGYNDYSLDALNTIKKNDKSFYRVDKNYGSSPAIFGSINDGMSQDYHSTSSYNPFNQEYYIFYLQLMGVSDKNNETQSRWAMGLTDRPLLEAINRVKYTMGKKTINPVWYAVSDTIGTYGDVNLFRSKILQPFGITYDHYIKESTFATLSNMQKDFVSLRAAVVKDSNEAQVHGLIPFDLKDTTAGNIFNLDVYRTWAAATSADTLAIKRFDDTHIEGTATTTADKMMYLSLPYDGGWNLTVDGQPHRKMILSAGMTGIMLPKGTHTIALEYHLRYVTNGLILGFIGILIYIAVWLVQTARRPRKFSPTSERI